MRHTITVKQPLLLVRRKTTEELSKYYTVYNSRKSSINYTTNENFTAPRSTLPVIVSSLESEEEQDSPTESPEKTWRKRLRTPAKWARARSRTK